jgi:hypothetical protein
MDFSVPKTELQRDEVVIVLIERVHVHRLRQSNAIEITAVGRDGRNIAGLFVRAVETEYLDSHHGLRAKSSGTCDEDSVNKHRKRQQKQSHGSFLGYPRPPHCGRFKQQRERWTRYRNEAHESAYDK